MRMSASWSQINRIQVCAAIYRAPNGELPSDHVEPLDDCETTHIDKGET